MTSKFEEHSSGLPQEHSYSFSPFVTQLPSKLQSHRDAKKPGFSKAQKPSFTQLRAQKERKASPISLPDIVVCKLQEKTPKKPTQPLKSNIGPFLAQVDCKFCKDDTKKRLIPSLVPPSMMSNRIELEWSQREYAEFNARDFDSDEGGDFTGDRLHKANI